MIPDSEALEITITGRCGHELEVTLSKTLSIEQAARTLATIRGLPCLDCAAKIREAEGWPGKVIVGHFGN